MQRARAIKITAIRLNGGTGAEHVTHLYWEGASSSGLTTTAAIIAWLGRNPDSRAILSRAHGEIALEVVNPSDRPAHLRCAGGTDDRPLLALPRF
jgi:hypothetical protein